MRISYILRKIFVVLPVIFVISLLCFNMIYFAPGDAGKLLLETKSGRGDRFSASDIADFSERTGLDLDVVEAYWNWSGDLLKGDMGESVLYSEPVSSVVNRYFRNTLVMVGIAFVVYLITGISLGFASGLRPGGFFDRLNRFWATLTLSLPSFWIATLVLFLSTKFFPGFPVLYFDGWRSFVVPGVIMGLIFAGNLAMMLRDRVLRVSEEDFIDCAKAMGISRSDVVWRHIFPNVLATMISVSALDLSFMLMGSLVLEKIFSIPGIGQLFLKAVNVKDYFLVAGCTLYFCLSVSLCNLIAELIYPFIDRRQVCSRNKKL